MLFINKLFNSIACLLYFINLQLMIPGRTWILLYLGRTVYKRLWACLALYDICIFAETADQMLDCIELIFSRLKEFNLKIKPKKLHFFQKNVTFLGHFLSADGVSPNPEKVTKIKDWPTPKTTKEVHSFIGLSLYYSRFIPNFAKWTGPLHALIAPASFKQKIRKGQMKKSDLPEFQWTPVCDEGFNQLKKALTEAPVLVYPDYSKPFILETDTSLKGLGILLSQKGDDNEIRV